MMKPLKDLIVIEIETISDKKTDTGLYLPKDRWGEKENVAVIKAIPDGLTALLKVGDKVVINPYAVLDTPDKVQKLIRLDDILAIWEE